MPIPWRNAGDRMVEAASAVHGYTVATSVSLGILLFAAVLAFCLVDHRPPSSRACGESPESSVRAVADPAGS